MPEQTIFNVDATALFYKRPNPKMGDLLTELNAALSSFPDCHLQFSPLSHADWWLLTCSRFHIMISFAEHASDAPKLAEAARAPICELRRFDYPQAVSSHQAHVQIEVGDGDAPLPPEARLIMQEFGESAVCDTRLKLKALHFTMQAIAQQPGLLAMHFGPTERLFCPEELAEFKGKVLPVALLLHPCPSLPEPGPSGRDGYALRLKHPQFLSGPALELEGIPVSIPLATSVSLLKTLIKAYRLGKWALRDGETLKPSPKITLYIRELPANESAPSGRLILSFWPSRNGAPTRAKAAMPADVLPVPDAVALAPMPPKSQDADNVIPVRPVAAGKRTAFAEPPQEDLLFEAITTPPTPLPNADRETAEDVLPDVPRSGVLSRVAARLRTVSSSLSQRVAF